MATLTKAGSNKFVSLKSLRNLRPWFKDAASDDVQDVIDQLEKLKREKIHEEDERALRLSGHHDGNLSNNLHLQSHMQYDPQDILDALLDRFSCRMRRYRSARVKYRFFDLDGNLCEWSGQGREPIKLRELLKVTGQKRDDFLVKDDNTVNPANNDIIQSKTERFYKSLEENSRDSEATSSEQANDEENKKAQNEALDGNKTDNETVNKQEIEQNLKEEEKAVINNVELSEELEDLEDSDKDSA